MQDKNDKNHALKANKLTNILQVVKLLKLEADAITKAANRLESEQVERAVELLANCQEK